MRLPFPFHIAGGAAALPAPVRRRVLSAVPAKLISLVLLATLLAPLAGGALQAQERTTGYRKLLYSLIGAAVGGGAAALAQPSRRDMWCGSRSCMLTMGIAIGGTAGFLIGWDRDKAAAASRSVGPRLRLEKRAVDLTGIFPETLDPFSGGVVVAGREGVAVVRGPSSLPALRAQQLRSITSATALPVHNSLLTATPQGIYAFTLSGVSTGVAGRLVESEPTRLIEAVSSDGVVASGGPLIRRLRAAGQGGDLTLEQEAQVTVENTPDALNYSAADGVIWTLVGDQLVARSGTTLQDLGSVTLPVVGQFLTIDGDRALVTAGRDGMVLVDISRPGAPSLVARIGGIRYVYGAVLEGSRAYVAAGHQGLVVVDLADPTHPQIEGVARDLGFVGAVARNPAGGFLVLDREGPRLWYVELQAGGAVSN